MPEPRYDFFSPFLSAAIITPDGERWPLWNNVSERGGVAAARIAQAGLETNALAFLQEITVELQLAYLPKIQATLTPPFRDGIDFLSSELIEWGQSTLEVQFGYSGRGPGGAVLSPVLVGTLLKPDVQIGTDVVITLQAQGVGGFSAGRQESGRVFRNRTRYEIIQEVLRGHDPDNQRPVQVDTSEVNAQADSEANDLLNFQQVNVAQGYQTDWAFIWRLVRESQCWMTLVGDTLRVFPRNSAVTARPVRTLALFDFSAASGDTSSVADRIGPAAGVFPILSVSSPTMAVYLPGTTRALVLQGIRSGDREHAREVFGDDLVQPARTGDGSADGGTSPENPGPSADGEGGSFHYGSVDNPDVLAQARAEFSAQTFAMGVKLEIETIGIPDLIPGDTIAVRGLGIRLSHNYAVHSVVHTVGLGGFTTRLECISNASRILSQAVPQLQVAGQVNTEEPPEALDQEVIDVIERLGP